MPFSYYEINSKPKQCPLEEVSEQTENTGLLQIQGPAELADTVTERLFGIRSCIQTPLIATKMEHFFETSHPIRIRSYLV